jgi:HNH endonuclease
MNTHAHPTPSSAAASPRGAATPSLELMEARQLRDALKLLLRQEQAAMADFLIALADFDRRRGWESLGHANLFSFVRAELGLSRSGSYWRLSAARLVQRFPEVIEPLREGRLCMSTTAELAKVLTEENRDEVLPRYFGLSAREAQEVTAELAPRQELPVRDLVTRVEQDRGLRLVEPTGPTPGRSPMANPAATATQPVAASPTGGSVQTSGHLPAQPTRLSAPSTRDDVEPLTADLRRLHITVSREFLRDLERARDGLSHAIPSATTEQVLQVALRLLLETQARARGQVKRPRSSIAAAAPLAEVPADTAATPREVSSPIALIPTEPPSPRRTGPRETIPAAVRRAVWERDQGRCAWPLDAGGCCGSTHQLELDHVVPWARDGEPTVENLRLVCHRHNLLAARRAFGTRVMARYASP